MSPYPTEPIAGSNVNYYLTSAAKLPDALQVFDGVLRRIYERETRRKNVGCRLSGKLHAFFSRA